MEGPDVINYEDGERMVIVQSNVRGRDLGGFAAEVQQRVREQVELPPGYFVTCGGQFENQERATRGLITSTFLTLIVLPVVYEWLEERWPEWAAKYHHQVRRRRLGSRSATDVEPAGAGD